MITKQEVLELARICRIQMDECEAEAYQAELTGMISFASVLEGTELEKAQAHGFFATPKGQDKLRPDAVGESLLQAEALSLSCDTEDGCLRVPRAVEE